jgi:hypothetical protein
MSALEQQWQSALSGYGLKAKRQQLAESGMAAFGTRQTKADIQFRRFTGRSGAVALAKD